MRLLHADVREALLWLCGRYFPGAGPTTAAQVAGCLCDGGSADLTVVCTGVSAALAGVGLGCKTRYDNSHVTVSMPDPPGCPCGGCQPRLDATLVAQAALLRPYLAAAAWEMMFAYVTWVRENLCASGAIDEDVLKALGTGRVFRPEFVQRMRDLALEQFADEGLLTCDVCVKRLGVNAYTQLSGNNKDYHHFCTRHQTCAPVGKAVAFMCLLTEREMEALLLLAAVSPAHAHRLLTPEAMWAACKDMLPGYAPALSLDGSGSGSSNPPGDTSEATARTSSILQASLAAADISGVVAKDANTCVTPYQDLALLGQDNVRVLERASPADGNPLFLRLAGGLPGLVDMRADLLPDDDMADLLAAAGKACAAEVPVNYMTLADRYGPKCAEFGVTQQQQAEGLEREPKRQCVDTARATYHVTYSSRDLQIVNAEATAGRPVSVLLAAMAALVAGNARPSDVLEALYFSVAPAQRTGLLAQLGEVIRDGKLTGPLPHGVKVVNFPSDYNLDSVVPDLAQRVTALVAERLPQLLGRRGLDGGVGEAWPDLVELLPAAAYDRFKMYLSLGLAVTDAHVDDTAAFNLIVWAAGADANAVVATWIFAHTSSTQRVHALLERIKLRARGGTRDQSATAFAFRAELSLLPAEFIRMCRTDGIPVMVVYQHVGDLVLVPPNSVHVVWTHYPALKLAADYMPAFGLHPCMVLTDAMVETEAAQRLDPSGILDMHKRRRRKGLDSSASAYNADRASPHVILEMFVRRHEYQITQQLAGERLALEVDWKMVLSYQQKRKKLKLINPLHATPKPRINGGAAAAVAAHAATSPVTAPLMRYANQATAQYVPPPPIRLAPAPSS